ncbi:hypothetical protein N7454_003777 [Penicillium verhagenii]|nr:hypothetical protein N7454_003777 [Penicillium verhagenii]
MSHKAPLPTRASPVCGSDRVLIGDNNTLASRRWLPDSEVPGETAKLIMELPWICARKNDHIKSDLLCSLIELPSVREPLLRDKKDWPGAHLNKQIGRSIANVESAAMQVVGRVVSVPCKACVMSLGPWARCVVVDETRNTIRSCANCHWRKQDRRCDFLTAKTSKSSLHTQATATPSDHDTPGNGDFAATNTAPCSERVEFGTEDPAAATTDPTADTLDSTAANSPPGSRPLALRTEGATSATSASHSQRLILRFSGARPSDRRASGKRASGKRASGKRASGKRASGKRASGKRASGKRASGKQAYGKLASGTQVSGSGKSGTLQTTNTTFVDNINQSSVQSHESPQAPGLWQAKNQSLADQNLILESKVRRLEVSMQLHRAHFERLRCNQFLLEESCDLLRAASKTNPRFVELEIDSLTTILHCNNLTLLADGRCLGNNDSKAQGQRDLLP